MSFFGEIDHMVSCDGDHPMRARARWRRPRALRCVACTKMHVYGSICMAAGMHACTSQWGRRGGLVAAPARPRVRRWTRWSPTTSPRLRADQTSRDGRDGSGGARRSGGPGVLQLRTPAGNTHRPPGVSSFPVLSTHLAGRARAAVVFPRDIRCRIFANFAVCVGGWRASSLPLSRF